MTGTPLALQLNEHIVRWARLYPGPKKLFAQEVRDFQKQWSLAKGSASELHEGLAQRRIATLEEEKREREEKRRKAEQYDRQLRQLFRSRTLLDE